MRDMANMKFTNRDDPFLAPIEAPKDPILKQVYAAQEAHFGKAITPAKVLLARLPPAFAQFYGRSAELDKELKLSQETALLIREQVARINICLFCIDSVRAATILASMNQAKFDALEACGSSSLFTEAAPRWITRASLRETSGWTRTRSTGWPGIIPSGRYVKSFT